MKIVVEHWSSDGWVPVETISTDPASVLIAGDDEPLSGDSLVAWSESVGSVLAGGKRVEFLDSPELWVEGYVRRAKSLSRVRTREV